MPFTRLPFTASEIRSESVRSCLNHHAGLGMDPWQVVAGAGQGRASHGTNTLSVGDTIKSSSLDSPSLRREGPAG